MVHLMILLMMTLGFSGLALAMERHQRDLLGRSLPQRTSRHLAFMGWVLICTGLVTAMGAFGPWFGLAIHAGHASAAAALVVLAMIGWGRR